MNFRNLFKPINEPGKKLIIVLLGLLTLVNIGLHIWRISYPATPVFDEVHFSSYAAEYIKDQAYFDIHPPLGKMIYGVALKLSGSPGAGNANFVTYSFDQTKKTFQSVVEWGPFGNFPYVLLRYVSIFFGVLLPIVFFWFLRSIGIGRIGAFMGAMFVVLDSALLLETKLILMNGMMLVFAFAALALFFSKKESFWVAGLFFGLALSVKLTAISFFAVVFFWEFVSKFRKGGVGRAMKVLLVALGILFILYLINFALFSIPEHFKLLNLPVPSEAIAGAFSSVKAFAISGGLFVFETLISVSGYLLSSGATHSQSSPWYLWPFGEKSMLYDTPANNPGGTIMLVANRPLWLLAFIATIACFIILPRYIKKYINHSKKDKTAQLAILLSGFLFSLLPYFTAVNRSTFIYHYFPALLFAFGLLAWVIENKFKNWTAIIIIAGIVVAGFIAQLGCVYGAGCF